MTPIYTLGSAPHRCSSPLSPYHAMMATLTLFPRLCLSSPRLLHSITGRLCLPPPPLQFRVPFKSCMDKSAGRRDVLLVSKKFGSVPMISNYPLPRHHEDLWTIFCPWMLIIFASTVPKGQVLSDLPKHLPKRMHAQKHDVCKRPTAVDTPQHVCSLGHKHEAGTPCRGDNILGCVCMFLDTRP